MMAISYRDLGQFGLPLVTPGDPEYSSLVRDIHDRLPAGPFPPPPPSETDAVLVNHSGRSIVALEYVWRWQTVDGHNRVNRYSNLASSAQRDILTGAAKVIRDFGTFILPGSTRLITESGMFGNNLDVLSPDEYAQLRSFAGGSGGGSRLRGNTGEEPTRLELILDFAILEDGLCVGPDESGIFEELIESLELQIGAAGEAVKALREGATPGRIFDIIRPLARHRSPDPEGSHRRARRVLAMFGSEAIHRLVDADERELLAWFERAAQPPSLLLRRPS